jgi:hypothetical protein
MSEHFKQFPSVIKLCNVVYLFAADKKRTKDHCWADVSNNNASSPLEQPASNLDQNITTQSVSDRKKKAPKVSQVPVSAKNIVTVANQPSNMSSVPQVTSNVQHDQSDICHSASLTLEQTVSNLTQNTLRRAVSDTEMFPMFHDSH